MKNTQTPQNNPKYQPLPPALFWPIEQVKQAFGVNREGWSTLLSKGLHPVRVGNKYIVVHDNLRSVLNALSLSPALSAADPGPSPDSGRRNPPQPKSSPKKRVRKVRSPDELAKAEWLSIPEAARLIGVSDKTIRRAVNRGKLIDCDSTGKRVRLRRKQVELVFAGGGLAD